MGIATLKKINEKAPYWIKRPFAKIIRNKLINNKEFLNTYQFLVCSDEMSVDEKKVYQFQQVRLVLQHAYEHTEYYHKLFDLYSFDPYEVKQVEDLRRLPVLTKDILKIQLDSMLANNIGDFYLVTTGGTTGEPTKVMMEKKAIYKEWAFIYHFWSKYGYDFKSSKLATFRGVEMVQKICEINPLYSEIRMNLFKMNLQNIVLYNEKIRQYGADFIYGYPSAIYNYCRLSREAGIKLEGKYKAVLLISENLYPFQKELISEVLGCPIAIFYGHSERAVFAENFDKGYIFNPMYGVTEISEDGALIVTGLINEKTPLIRYVVDDKVEEDEEGYYKIVGHRTSDVLVGLNGEQVSVAAINFHDDTFDGTTGYQFVQTEAGKFIVNVTADTILSDEKMQLISERVQRKLGKGYSCHTIQVAEMEKTARGKYIMLIQKINGANR